MSIDAQLSSLYRDVLGRAPDPGGLNYYKDIFGPTLEPNEIAAFIGNAQGEISQRASNPQALAASLAQQGIQTYWQPPAPAQTRPATVTPVAPAVLPPTSPVATPTLGQSSQPVQVTSAGGESRIDPALRPFLIRGLQEAQGLFFGPGPQFFPGQTFVSPSEQTLAALQQQEALARGNQPALQEAQRAFLAGLGPSAAAPLFQDLYGAGARQIGAPMYESVAGGGFRNLALDPTMQTAAGSFLMGSPYQQALIEQSVRPIARQLGEVTLPGIQSAFSAAGRYGSGAQQRAIGEAVERASRAAGDVATQIGAGTYAQERGLQEAARQQLAGLSQQDLANRLAAIQGLEASQQAAFARQMQAAGGLGAAQEAQLARGLTGAQLAPQIYAQQFLPSQQLGQIGAAREQIAAQPLQEQMARFQFAQQVPYQQLQGFLSSVYGTPMSSSNIPQAQTNQFGQALGGAVLGAQLGSIFDKGLFGFTPTQTQFGGAALGALAGLLG